jgi:transcription-repair coupling factor (superfamily II helicase)
MPNITITLTDTQFKGLEYVALSPQDWAENAVTERCRIANDEIISMYTNRALDEGVAIPATRELIVADAFTRGWAETAEQRNAEAEAASETP